MEPNLFYALIAIVFFTVFCFILYRGNKNNKIEWDKLDDLKEKINKVTSTQEIIKLHALVLDFAFKTSNPLIRQELKYLSGYLDGLLKQYQSKSE